MPFSRIPWEFKKGTVEITFKRLIHPEATDLAALISMERLKFVLTFHPDTYNITVAKIVVK